MVLRLGYLYYLHAQSILALILLMGQSAVMESTPTP